MTPVTTFRGKTVAVFGLGASGLATCAALAAGGAKVVAWDDQPAKIDEAKAKGYAAEDLRALDWSAVTALVLSPGVPLTHPKPHWAAALASQHKVEIIGDIELFCRERRASVPNAPFVAITGTNGKSTTTALVAHILKSSGRDVAVGGNLGTPILSLPPPALHRTHVIECSSYQIDLAPTLDPTVGILLNITPDHLDRHGTMKNYAAVKERLVARSDTAVIAVDDEFTCAAAVRLEKSGQRVIRVSAEEELAEGFFLDETSIVHADKDGAVSVADLAGIGSLRGRHNAQNAATAIATALSLGVSPEAIRKGLFTFPGLAHRMEELGHKGKVLFVNDSKATNADSTEKALSSFAGGIFWILGGKEKEGGITSLKAFFPKIAKAYLIGEASDAFAATLEGKVPYAKCGTLDVAVTKATEDAVQSKESHPVVLLSPAGASFDQFPNFEVRGDHFRALVRAIPGIKMLHEAAA
ncbi:MAG TPA: UDP-N-acetylmuramoyl-L-alanine--D-glutamate ligase [Xanthobacteraceae bacterium]|nr:UDP-N-acetylmuramoyl-L-alanine--D-glutamate ligase [Xanthobacteraceae bacterium]